MQEYECPKCKKISDFESWNESTRKQYGDNIYEMGIYGGDFFCCPNCSETIDYDKSTEGEL